MGSRSWTHRLWAIKTSQWNQKKNGVSRGWDPKFGKEKTNGIIVLMKLAVLANI